MALWNSTSMNIHKSAITIWYHTFRLSVEQRMTQEIPTEQERWNLQFHIYLSASTHTGCHYCRRFFPKASDRTTVHNILLDYYFYFMSNRDGYGWSVEMQGQTNYCLKFGLPVSIRTIWLFCFCMFVCWGCEVMSVNRVPQSIIIFYYVHL